MSTVEEIIAAIDRLSPSEREKLDAFLDREWDAWDRQIEADFDSGKLDALLKEVDGEIAAGRVEEGP